MGGEGGREGEVVSYYKVTEIIVDNCGSHSPNNLNSSAPISRCPEKTSAKPGGYDRCGGHSKLSGA